MASLVYMLQVLVTERLKEKMNLPGGSLRT